MISGAAAFFCEAHIHPFHSILPAASHHFGETCRRIAENDTERLIARRIDFGQITGSYVRAAGTVGFFAEDAQRVDRVVRIIRIIRIIRVAQLCEEERDAGTAVRIYAER